MAKEQKTTAVTTRTPTRQMRKRATIAVLLVIVLFFTMNIVRLGELQLVQADDWQKRAVSQQLSDTVVTASPRHHLRLGYAAAGRIGRCVEDYHVPEEYLRAEVEKSFRRG